MMFAKAVTVVRGLFSAGLQALPDPSRVSAVIEDGMDQYDIGFDTVVNRIRKPFGQQSVMVADIPRVDTSVDTQ
jgi:hypothetical protein